MSSAELTGQDLRWSSSGSLAYGVQGGRDVLIVESDHPPLDPEVVPRWPSHLTDEQKQKLKSQGVSSDDLDEASIIRERYEQDKRRTLFRVIRSEPDNLLSLDTVQRSINELFQTTKNDGGIVHSTI